MNQELKKYSPDEIIEKIAKLEDWAYDSENEEIFKVFKFKGYYKTIAFVNCVAWEAQKQVHHPDLKVSFGECEVRLTTHDADGISDRDFKMAETLNSL